MAFTAANILTTRAEVWVGSTTIAKPGKGSVQLTSGSAGSIDTLLVNSISIIRAAVAYNTSLAQTAVDLADAINSYTPASGPAYRAYADITTAPTQPTVYIVQTVIATGTITVASTVTTIAKTDTSITGGAQGAGGVHVGMTESGIEFKPNDQWLLANGEEFGASIVRGFYIAGTPSLSFVLKEWRREAMALAFPGGHFSDASHALSFSNAVRNPGEALDGAAVQLEIRPTNFANPSVIVRKAILVGRAAMPVMLRTTETRRLGVEFMCLDAASGTPAGVFIGPACNFTL